MEKDDFASSPRNTKELANHYSISPKTFRLWLKKANLNLGTRLGYYFSPRQVKIIIDHLSAPFIWFAMLFARLFADFDNDPDLDKDHDQDHHGPHHRQEDPWTGSRWEK